MTSNPKPPRRDSAAPDGVSTTGSRPAGQGVERAVPAGKTTLETFEQSPPRGTDDARMMQTGEAGGARATPDGDDSHAGPHGRGGI